MPSKRRQAGLRDRFRARVGYTVQCDAFTHTAFTWSDALAWVATYPDSFGRVIVKRRGRVVAIRQPQGV